MAGPEGQVGREVLVGHVSTPLGVPATVEIPMKAMLMAEGTFLTVKSAVQCRCQETSSWPKIVTKLLEHLHYNYSFVCKMQRSQFVTD